MPGKEGYAKNITVGRNAPDAWTTFNGDIGDVFLYKVALTDAERKIAMLLSNEPQTIESFLKHYTTDSVTAAKVVIGMLALGLYSIV